MKDEAGLWISIGGGSLSDKIQYSIETRWEFSYSIPQADYKPRRAELAIISLRSTTPDYFGPERSRSSGYNGPDYGDDHEPEIVPIGKESNCLEEVDAKLMHSASQVYTVYPDRRRDYWTREVLRRLKSIPVTALVEKTGLSRSMLINVRSGRTRPQPRNQLILIRALRATR